MKIADLAAVGAVVNQNSGVTESERSDDVGRTMSRLVDQHGEQLVELWQRLGADGPTFASPDAGNDADARERYLIPLSRTLRGALAGSADHLAVYLDERLRYAEGASGKEATRERCRVALGVEIPLLTDLFASAGATSTVRQKLTELHEPLWAPAATAERVLFIGDCLFVETRAFLLPLARQNDRPLDVRHIFFSANQGLEGANRVVTEEVAAFSPDVIGVSLFSFEGVPPYANAWRRAAVPHPGDDVNGIVAGLVELLRQLISDIRTVTDRTIVVHAPGGLPLDPIRRRLSFLPAHSRAQRRLLALLGSAIRNLVDGTENTILMDERELCAGRSLRGLDGPVFDSADVPAGYSHTTQFGPLVARRYADLAAAYWSVGKAKAILVDFDNTLWSGVMAEGPVTHDLELQRALLALKDAGIVLVAVSKNDPASIRWSEMVIKESDFVLTKINWRPKPDNVSEAIAELDLAPDAFVLLDDNPVERALVTEQLPGVRSLDPGEDRTRETLNWWMEFPSTRQTEESRRRTEMYREAAERRRAMSSVHDYPSMMRSLKLRCTVRPAVTGDRDRLLELIQRTNQFNTTTRRRSASEVDALFGHERIGVYTLALRDRFGDLGVVAVAIFDRDERCFDSVIMSCRAMGFGVETALLRTVMDEEGPGSFDGLFIPTERNAPASSLFSAAGFENLGNGHWALSENATRPEVPSWLELRILTS